MGSESRLFGPRDESGGYPKAGIGQIIGCENENYQCEHGSMSEAHQKQNNNLSEIEILEGLDHRQIIMQTRVKLLQRKLTITK